MRYADHLIVLYIMLIVLFGVPYIVVSVISLSALRRHTRGRRKSVIGLSEQEELLTETELLSES